MRNSTGGLEFVWTGDMWQSAPNGIKAHDRQFWSQLRWEYDAAAGVDMPMGIEWLDSWTLDIADPTPTQQPVMYSSNFSLSKWNERLRQKAAIETNE